MVNFFENLIYLPILEVEILGYCDDRGSVEYNQELSEKRVETVAEWLIDHNVNMKNIDKQISGWVLQYNPGCPVVFQ